MILVDQGKYFGLSSLALIAWRCQGRTKLKVPSAELETQRVLCLPCIAQTPQVLLGVTHEERCGEY